MIAAATAPDINQSVINIGSGKETPVREVAQKIITLTEGDAEILYTPRNDPGVERLCADITLAKQKLNYNPRFDLEEGLRLTLQEDPRFST
jgi:nucleoside-diphosphate-sugar epimerase